MASSFATVSNSPSGFESSDGNMVLNTTTGANTDWNCFVGSAGFQPGTPNSNCKVSTGAKDVQADANGEIQLVNGTKFDDKCPGLNTGNNPPKDEFQYVASYSDTASNGDAYFYGSTIRPNTNGNSSGNIEFNQLSGDGTTTHGCRSSGDRLVQYDFLNGGTTLQFQVLTYITSSTDTAGGNNTAGTTGCFSGSSAKPPCWGAKVIHPDSSQFEGGVNTTGGITAANNGISGSAIATNAFAEFGINLSQALGLSGQCLSFPQQVWESRSSGSSFTSNPQDLEFDNQRISNCGTITIIKHTDPRGQNQAFSYTTTGGLTPSTFSLNDNNNSTTDSTANTQTYSNVPAGSYSVTEGTEPTGYSLEDLTCTDSSSTSGSGGTATGAKATATATISLKANDQVVCTYQNQALGEVKIIKHTDPRGLDQSFSYSSNLTGATSFALNDTGNSTSDNAANTKDVTGLAVGQYNVTETEPDGWTLESLSCSTGGSQNATTATKADINLTAGATITCTYTNKAPSGAILITKTGKDKACASSSTTIANGVCTGASSADLGGATFKITTDSAGDTPVSGSPKTTSNTSGTVCIDGLFWNGAAGTTYYVSETGPPTGYSADSSNTDPLAVTVVKNAKCTDSGIATEAAAAGFNDKPLTKLTVTASAVVPGATNSTVQCATDSALTNNIGNSPVANGDPATMTADASHGGALTPGTYYCKVVIDP